MSYLTSNTKHLGHFCFLTSVELPETSDHAIVDKISWLSTVKEIKYNESKKMTKDKYHCSILA